MPSSHSQSTHVHSCKLGSSPWDRTSARHSFFPRNPTTSLLFSPDSSTKNPVPFVPLLYSSSALLVSSIPLTILSIPKFPHKWMDTGRRFYTEDAEGTEILESGKKKHFAEAGHLPAFIGAQAAVHSIEANYERRTRSPHHFHDPAPSC